MKPVVNNFGGIKYKFEIFKADDFSNLSNVKQVYGLVLNDLNELLLVSGKKKLWLLPGGKMKKEETYIETLTREVYEESSTIIDQESIKPFFYQRQYLWDEEENNWKHDSYQLRYVCKAKKIETFIADKDIGDIHYNKWIQINDLDKHLKWKETTVFIQKHLIQFIKQNT